MKKILVMLAVFCLSSSVFAQVEITEKGYFYSPDGFVCKDGNIYTADMKTVVRFGFLSDQAGQSWDEDYGYKMVIPEGAEVIPSNVLYHPTPHHHINNTRDCLYSVVIPSSVKYIAVDAFIFPFVRFFNSGGSLSIPEKTNEKSNTREVARYNLQGQKIDNPQSGINIVQMSDHTAHKELIK